MRKLNLENVNEAGEYKSLPAGGYICRYVSVEDVPEKEYLYMEYDIAKGEFENYYKELAERKSFWGGKCYRSYKEKALPMFKRMCSAVSKSNNGFVFDGGEVNANEKTLEGKLVGMVFGEEEYVGNDGNIKKRLYVVRECSVEDIVKGNFKVPAVKLLKTEDYNNATASSGSSDDFMNVSGNEDDVPFK